MKKRLIKLASGVFPGIVANVAYDKLTSPQISRLRQHENEVIEKAESDFVNFRDVKIRTYKWGSGSKKVLFVHGWEGQAGNFAEFVEEFVRNDYTVFSFDGPSHGSSSKGRTSLFEFSDVVAEMIRRFEVKKLVSHSFGSVAATSALASNQDIEIDRYVLLTTPDRFLDRIDDVVKSVGVSQRVATHLVRRIEREASVIAGELNVSDFVKTARVGGALIIHDKRDSVIPIERARNVAKNWEQGKLVEIEGTGHFRILRTKSVIDQTLAFLDS